MARFTLPLLLYSTATFRRFSSDSMQQQQLRNVWISGLVDPSKVRVSERYWLYTGEIDKMIEARKETEEKDKHYESIVKEESWLNKGKKRDSHRYCKWLMNGPSSDSTSADVTFFNWTKQYKVIIIIIFQFNPLFCYLHCIIHGWNGSSSSSNKLIWINLFELIY
jgi:hypothetical protein